MTTVREKKILGLYLDGELSPARAVAFERKIEGSPELRAELEEMKKLRSAVSACGPRLVDSDFTGFPAKVAQGLKSAPKESMGSRLANSYEPRTFRYATLTIAAMLLLAMLAFTYFDNGKPAVTRVRVIEFEVADGLEGGFYSPEGANYSVVRISPAETEAIRVSSIEAADGYRADVRSNPGSKSVTIKINPDDVPDEPEE